LCCSRCHNTIEPYYSGKSMEKFGKGPWPVKEHPSL